MRKILLVCIVCVLFLLAGCGEDKTQAPTTVTTVQTEVTTEAPTTQASTTEPTWETTSTGLRLAPTFKVYSKDGASLTMEHFRGKPVVLNFWASSCPPCRSEMKAFQMAYDHYGSDYQFVMVNLTDGNWDTVESAYDFIDRNDYTFPVYYDTDQSATAAYGINAIPATFFIDAEGGAVAWYSGALDYDTLVSGLEMIKVQLPEQETTE